MYNGIGLPTPRGSGTNGYVQRNLSFIRRHKEKVNYRSEEDLKKLDAAANRQPNEEILAHERKRKIELKCLELQEYMEDQGFSPEEIELKIADARRLLIENLDCAQGEIPKDDSGRPIVKESHQMAEANQEKNQRLKEAFGISQYFVEGSSFDPNRKAKEAAAAAANAAASSTAPAEAQKKYALVSDSSSPSSSPEREKRRRKKRKSENARDRSLSPHLSKKKKSSKRRHRDRTTLGN